MAQPQYDYIAMRRDRAYLPDTFTSSFYPHSIAFAAAFFAAIPERPRQFMSIDVMTDQFDVFYKTRRIASYHAA